MSIKNSKNNVSDGLNAVDKVFFLCLMKKNLFFIYFPNLISGYFYRQPHMHSIQVACDVHLSNY